MNTPYQSGYPLAQNPLVQVVLLIYVSLALLVPRWLVHELVLGRGCSSPSRLRRSTIVSDVDLVGGVHFLKEVESWDGWTEGGELAVFEPYVVEVY
jgi:hypothetical protein